MAATEAVATAQAEATLTLTAGELLELRQWVEDELDFAEGRERRGMTKNAYWQAREAVFRPLVAKLRRAEAEAMGGQTGGR